MKPGAMLATNTSSITLETLAAKLADPSRLVGLHFFNPVAQMPLVEVVHSAATRPEVARSRASPSRARIDKLPLPCRSAPGFLVNRVLMPYMNEALHRRRRRHAARRHRSGGSGLRHADGADRARGRRRPRRAAARRARSCARTRSEAPRPSRHAPAWARRGNSAARAARASTSGRTASRCGPPAARARARTDLEDRLMLRDGQRSRRLLREGIVEDADLIDAGVIFGTGFAPFRGGPLPTRARAASSRASHARANWRRALRRAIPPGRRAGQIAALRGVV